jgi:hypothetical protein
MQLNLNSRFTSAGRSLPDFLHLGLNPNGCEETWTEASTSTALTGNAPAKKCRLRFREWFFEKSTSDHFLFTLRFSSIAA